MCVCVCVMMRVLGFFFLNTIQTSCIERLAKEVRTKSLETNFFYTHQLLCKVYLCTIYYAM